MSDVDGLLLEGIVGSTAYGLAHAGSDVDRLGVYAAPTIAFHGLHPPLDGRASIVEHDPDRTLHEARKYCRLALSGNPTVIDLLWLPDGLYEVRTELGDALIAIRGAFLSAPRIRDAYLGYAVQQLQRLVNKDAREASPAKLAKHARHLARLTHQGRDLYATGKLTVRLEDPGWYRDFGEAAAADPERARALIAEAEADFVRIRSPLPGSPDEATVESWLLAVRKAH